MVFIESFSIFLSWHVLIVGRLGIDTLRKGLETVNVHTRSHFEPSWDLKGLTE